MSYKALNTSNLPDPGVDPNQGEEPRDYFESFIYTGNGDGLQVGDVTTKPADTTTISNSLIFNDGDSPYLSRTVPSDGAGNQDTFTISCWVKRSDTDTESYLFSAANTSASTELFYVQLRSDTHSNVFNIAWRDNASSPTYTLTTRRRFTNSLTWDHFVIAVDTTQSTDTDKIKVYVNGVLETNFSADSRSSLSSSSSLAVNAASTLHTIGTYSGTLTGYLDGYLAEYHFVDGTAHAATDFGNFDANGIWIPKAVTAVSDYGTNGFHLDFSDNTSTATLGEDQTANGNNWTVNNFSTTDQVTDSPTNNFATFNIGTSDVCTFSEGNLKNGAAASAWRNAVLLPTSYSGKFYVEFTRDSGSIWSSVGSNVRVAIGVATKEAYDAGFSSNVWGYDDGTVSWFDAGYIQENPTSASLTGADSSYTYTNGDVLAVTVDFDTSEVKFYKYNTGTSSMDLVKTVTVNGRPYYIGTCQYAGVITANTGSKPFTATPPTGFVALSENNITVDDQNLESPDLVWIKNRTGTQNHYLQDSVRGARNYLSSNNTNAENAYSSTSTSAVLDFNKNGFTLGADAIGMANTSGQDYFALCWKAAGSDTTISAGSIDGTDPTIPSTVRANQKAGFSIVKWTGNGTTNATVDHGLDSKPRLIIIKPIENNSYNNWQVQLASEVTGAERYLRLNLDDTSYTLANYMTNVGNQVLTFPGTTAATRQYNNSNNIDFIAYCFTDVEGYCKIGTYEGNNALDGPFVYTGFKPAFVIQKGIDASSNNWHMSDNKVNPFNPVNEYKVANESSDFADVAWVDFVSNGFKLRYQGGGVNAAQTYVYMAFAEQPFKYANAR